jgi:hypothetical protein
MQIGVKVTYYCALVIFYLITVSAEPTDESLPVFNKIDCLPHLDLCLSVSFSDGSEDFINAKESLTTKFVLKGRLVSTGAKAVIILRDEFNDLETIAFKSAKVDGCTTFSVDLNGSGYASCIKLEPRTDDDVDDEIFPELNDDSALEDGHSRRRKEFEGLNPNGYVLNVVVYYDDTFARR